MPKTTPFEEKMCQVIGQQPIRIVEVAILRCISKNEMNGIVEADNAAPGNGIMYLYTANGAKLKVEITLCAALATENKYA